MYNTFQTGVTIVTNRSSSSCFMCGANIKEEYFRISLTSYDRKLLYTIDLCSKCCLEFYDDIASTIKMYNLKFDNPLIVEDGPQTFYF